LLYNTRSWYSEKTRDGNVILIGDAAHMFYPMGGYGMNLAIKDGFFLAYALKNYMTLEDFEKNSLEATVNAREKVSSKETNDVEEFAHDPRMEWLSSQFW
jgi:2-polyprenyl-6-methoxyphenol hydroxylase-like FAD-dependent oxidoreductase